MRLLKTIALEIWGLFVDDGAFALAVLCWLAIAGIGAHMLPRSAWMPPTFFAGLVLILAGGAVRQARRVKK
jgi:hypothetical protein